MLEAGVKIRPTDLDATVINFLDENGLPTEDLRDTDAHVYEVLRDSERVGIGALQPEGRDALLRSIAIKENCRNEGFGTHLVETLLEKARQQNYDAVYLLTDNAPAFFENLGFEEIPRSDAPPDIRATEQLKILCPESATCMRLELSSDS